MQKFTLSIVLLSIALAGCDAPTTSAEQKENPYKRQPRSAMATETPVTPANDQDTPYWVERASPSWLAEVDLTMDDSSPESAFRSFFKAMAAGDLERLKAICIEREDLKLLTMKPTDDEGMTDYQLKVMFDMAEKLKLKSYEVGDIFALPTGKKIEVTDSMVHENRKLLFTVTDPMPFPVERIGGKWKVDPRTIITVRQTAARLTKENQARRNAR